MVSLFIHHLNTKVKIQRKQMRVKRKAQRKLSDYFNKAWQKPKPIFSFLSWLSLSALKLQKTEKRIPLPPPFYPKLTLFFKPPCSWPLDSSLLVFFLPRFPFRRANPCHHVCMAFYSHGLNLQSSSCPPRHHKHMSQSSTTALLQRRCLEKGKT